MSISPMSSNVYNNMGYGAKAESPKKPAGAEPASVQPREEAPVASDTVELSAKKPADDTSATPALDTTATTTTTPPQAGLPLLPIIGGGVVGAGLGGIPTYMWWSDSEDGAKFTEDNGSFKSKDTAKYTVKDKTVTEVGDAKLSHDIVADGESFKISKTYGEVKSGDLTYNFEKSGPSAPPTLKTNLDNHANKAELFAWVPATPSPTALVTSATTTPSATVEHILEIVYGKGVLKAGDANKLEFTIAADKAVKITTAASADATSALSPANIAKAETALKDVLKIGDAHEAFKAIKHDTKLTDMLEGTKGKNWIAVGLAALGLGAVGAAAGWFYGKPKQVTAPDASTVS